MLSQMQHAKGNGVDSIEIIIEFLDRFKDMIDLEKLLKSRVPSTIVTCSIEILYFVLVFSFLFSLIRWVQFFLGCMSTNIYTWVLYLPLIMSFIALVKYNVYKKGKHVLGGWGEGSSLTLKEIRKYCLRGE